MASHSTFARIGLAGLLSLSACAAQNGPAEPSPPIVKWAVEDSTTNDVVTSVTSVDASGNVVIAVSRNPGGTEVCRYDASNNPVFDVTLPGQTGYVRGVFAASDGSTYAYTDGSQLAEHLVKLDASGKVIWSVTPSSGKSVVAVRELTNGDLGIIVEGRGTTTTGPFATHLSSATGSKTVALFGVPLPNASAFAMNVDGSMAFAGRFSAPIAATALSPAGSADTYVASADASGHVLWAISEGGDLDLAVEALAFLPDGSIVGGGEVLSTDNDLSDGHAFGADLASDVPFIVGFSAQGSVKWVTRTNATFDRIDAASFSVGPRSIFVGLSPADNGDDNQIAALAFDGTPLWDMPVKMDVLSVAAAPNGSYYAGGVITGVLSTHVQGNHQGILVQWK